MACQAGVPMTSEMRLFFQLHRGKSVGVTGSNGKSTTTAMIDSILRAAGLSTRLGGNIGKSLLPEVDDIRTEDWTVLELSSFQLDDLNRLPVSPDVAVVTNFSPNHLDWHGSIAEYRRSKQSIFRWQCREGIAVVNAGDDDVVTWPTFGRRFAFGTPTLGKQSPGPTEQGVFQIGSETIVRDASGERRLDIQSWLKIPGEHNRENAQAAACVAVALGLPDEAIQRGLEQFDPLPHRLQFVAEVAGRRFYNDSLATTPESAVVGMKSFSQPLVLLLGGYDKQVDLQQMATEAARRAKAVVLMGQTGNDLAAKIAESVRGKKAGPLTQVCADFPTAFDTACALSSPGDVILLSPGCASYDWFKNFADRGDQFSQRVRDLTTRSWPAQ